MGLDISAYSKLQLAENVVCDSDGSPVDDDNFVRVYENGDFPGRVEGLVDGAFYRYGDRYVDFRAGGYGSYNAWRNELAKLAGYPELTHKSDYGNRVGHDAGAWAADGGPFWEQINFTDCDGTIGPVVAAKLAKDYAEFEAKAEQIGGSFWALYQQWKEAFDVAADGGMVVFH